MAKTKKAAAAAVALTLSAAMGLAQNPRFAIRERDCFEPAAPSGDVLLFDGDGDGVKDILVRTGTIQAGYQLVFYRNDGTGRFVQGASSPVSSGGALSRFAVGDVDADGDDDIFAAQLMRNLGNGVMVWSPTTPSLRGIIIYPKSQFFDADADGDLDLWVQNAGLAQLWLNDGTGTFTTAPSGQFPAADSMLIDAEHDGDMDVILAGGGTRILMRNDGLGNYTVDATATLPQPTSFFVYLEGVAMDVDGDGFDDLAIPGVPDVLRNDGTGNFTPVSSTNLVDPATGTWFDWNMDGRADRWAGARIDVSTGNFAFGPVALPRRQHNIGRAWFADLDGDLDLDVVVAGDPVQVTFNTTLGARHGTSTATDLAYPYDQPQDVTVLDIQDGRNVLMAAKPINQTGQPALLRFYSNQAFVSGLDIYEGVAMATAGAFSDAAWVDDTFNSKGIVVCDPNGTGVTLLGNTPSNSSPLPASPTSTRVECGDLDGDLIPEIVLGDPSGNGPEVLRNGFSGFVSLGRIPVPPPPNHQAPAVEALVLADMDGDGDLDIVHELRVLTNDGSGAFVVASDFSALVGNNATDLLPIDFDGDGDQDLLVYGASTVFAASPTQLLRNDGATFVDATVGHLPPSEWATTKVASAADVDRDGDTDLLLCRSGNANLLRNDGGTFVRFPAVAPTGVLVDRDLDGYPDVFTGLRTYHNLHDHLWIPRPAALGIDWRIRVEAWREGPAVQYAMLAIGAPYSAVVDVPGLGTVKMDLGTAAVGTIPMVGGSGEVSIPIPTSPLLLGLQLGIQAVIADPLGWTLTDLVVDRIQ